MKPHRRRNYLINADIQFRYAVYVFSTLFVICLATTLFFSFGMWDSALKNFSPSSTKNRLENTSRINDYRAARVPQQISSKVDRLANFEEVEALSAREREILINDIRGLNSNLVPRVILLFVLIAMATVFLTHKIAGPLYRFKTTFEGVREGKLNFRVHLRHSDKAKEVLPELNKMINSLDETFINLKNIDAELKNEIESAETNIDKLKTIQTQLSSEIDKYVTSN